MGTVIIDKRKSKSYSGTKPEYTPGIKKSPSNLTPRIVSSLFILALQHYFISHPEYRWDPDGNKTEIDIHAEWEEDDNLEKGLPILIVQNGPISISPAGIGTGLASLEPRIIKRGKETMEKSAILDSQLQATIESSINIAVTGMSSDDVSELAFTIGMFLLTLKYDIASVLQLQSIGNIQISPAQVLSKTGWTNRYIAQISIGYTFTLAKIWEPLDVGTLIKEIITDVSTKTSRPTTPTTYTHNTLKQVRN